MNKVILMGRLTRDPEVRYSAGENALAIARYTLAVDRRFRRDGEATADFISCVSFGRTAEFAEKYFRQGLKIIVSGRIQTGSYTNRDGQKVYTTEVVVEEQEFAEGKNSSQQGAGQQPPQNYGGQQNAPQQSVPQQSQPQGYGQQGGYNVPQQSAPKSQPQGYGQQSVPQQNAPQQNYGGGSFGMGDDGFMNIPEGLDDELPFN